jgi:hypothetical protein
MPSSTDVRKKKGKRNFSCVDFMTESGIIVGGIYILFSTHQANVTNRKVNAFTKSDATFGAGIKKYVVNYRFEFLMDTQVNISADTALGPENIFINNKKM